MQLQIDGIPPLMQAVWPTRYAVRCTSNPSLFWSNQWGWVDRYFDHFSREETEELELPDNGQWIVMP